MRYPLVLPNRRVQRILNRNARVLILARRLPLLRSERTLNLKEIHSALTIRRNTRHRRNGRPDLQDDPHVLTIELLTVAKCKLADVDLKQVRAAGYSTVQEFRDDWQECRRELDLDTTVYVHTFQVIEQRYLARAVHRGYTHDPAEAIPGDTAALSKTDLERYATAASKRDGLIRLARRTDMSLEDRIRDLDLRARNGSRDAQRALFKIRQSVERAERKAQA